MEKITKKEILLIVLGAIAWPILTFISNLIVDSTNATGNWLTNKIFYTAAIITNESQDVIAFIIYMLFVFSFFWLYPKLQLGVKNSRFEYDKYKKEYDALEKITIEDEIKLKLLDDSYSSRKNFRSLIITLYIILIISLFVSTFIKSNAKRYYSDFKKDTEIIAPYVSDQQLKIYRSEWRLIKTLVDYNRIQHGIDSTKKANNLEK